MEHVIGSLFKTLLGSDKIFVEPKENNIHGTGKPVQYFALYDKTIARPAPIIGWYTTRHNHPNMPPQDTLLELTTDEWKWHFENPSGFGIDANNKLIEMEHPPSPMGKVFIAHMAAQNKGLEITSKTNKKLEGSHPVDRNTVTEIHKEIEFINMFGEFTSGLETLPWKKLDGTIVELSIDEFKTIAKHIIRFNLAMTKLTDAAVKSVIPVEKYPHNKIEV